MALYVIGDTHFSEGSNKPMDVFGGAWTGYRDKLVRSLTAHSPEDLLVVPGDFSGGMSLLNTECWISSNMVRNTTVYPLTAFPRCWRPTMPPGI